MQGIGQWSSTGDICLETLLVVTGESGHLVHSSWHLVDWGQGRC